MSDNWEISITGSYASGTYYGTFTGTFTGTYVYEELRVDISVSGTCWSIQTGTAEVETVTELLAMDGEWNIETNPQNIMVVDVRMKPIKRTAQYIGSSNNSQSNYYTFPHKHRAPLKFVSGSYSTLCSAFLPDAIVTKGNYVYFYRQDGDCVTRLDTISTGTVSTSLSPINRMFVVLDDDNVLFPATNLDDSDYISFYKINLITSETTEIGILPANPYYWHFGVIGNKLIVGSWSYTERDADFYLRYSNYVYNLDTGAQLYGITLPLIGPLWAWMQYPVCGDIIIGTKYFYIYHTDYHENDGFTAQMFVANVGGEQASIGRVPIYYEKGIGKNCFVYHFQYCPLNRMIYYIVYHAYGTSPNIYGCYAIGIMSPENYSYSYIYEYSYRILDTPEKKRIPVALIPSMKDLYVVMGTGKIFCVRNDINPDGQALAELPASLYSDFTYMLERPQPYGVSPVIDWHGRLWYVNDGDLMGVTVEGDESNYDIGISLPPIQDYGYPHYAYRQVHLGGNKIYILDHNTAGAGIGYIRCVNEETA